MNDIETKIKYDGGIFPPVYVPTSLLPLIDETGWRFVVSEPSDPTYEAIVSFKRGMRLPGREDEKFVPLAALLARMN